jgi:hypothetical protein
LEKSVLRLRSLNRETNEALEPRDVRANLIKAGIEPAGGSPQDFAARSFEVLTPAQIQRYAELRG